MKLILCANNRQLAGFKHHDIQPLPGIDYVCDLFDIEKHVEGKFEEVQFTHALEHFPTKDTPKVLDLLRRLLEDGGKLYLEVPNFAWHAKILLEEKRERDAVYYAFGGQLNEWDFHKTGFTENILREELEMAGFKNIEIQNASSLIARATK
jgi:predicted SAM-dependent methyltransferase